MLCDLYFAAKVGAFVNAALLFFLPKAVAARNAERNKSPRASINYCCSGTVNPTQIADRDEPVLNESHGAFARTRIFIKIVHRCPAGNPGRRSFFPTSPFP